MEDKKLRSLYATLSSTEPDLFSRVYKEREKNWSEAEKRIVDILSSLTGCEPGEIRRNSSILSEFRGHAMAEIQGSLLRRMWLVARTLVHSQGLSLLPSTPIIQAITTSTSTYGSNL